MSYVRRTELKGTTAEWTQYDPVLMDGESGYEKCDDGAWRWKIGDGQHKWSELPYAVDIDIDATQTATGATITITNRAGGTKTVTVDTLMATDTWANICSAVRLGLGPKLFPVGHTFEVPHAKFGTKNWVVLGHDICTNADTEGGHTMTICPVPILTTAQFDKPEALLKTDNELAAGTYCFTTPGYDQWLAGTYNFTLTKAVPAGGQICISGQYPYQGALTKAKVYSYESQTATAAIESVEIVSGAAGTVLGTLGEGNLNHVHRVAYGSNNYKESALRQLLNSEADAGSVWTPQTRFDRPPDWATTMAGFLNGLDEELKDVICTTVVKCGSNNVYEAPDSTITKGSTYTVNDKVFLLSNKEVGFSSDIADGSILMPYYDGAANADRIKYNASNAAASWWLRTPHSGYAHNVRLVYTDGSLHNYYARNALGLVPACNIG